MKTNDRMHQNQLLQRRLLLRHQGLVQEAALNPDAYLGLRSFRWPSIGPNDTRSDVLGLGSFWHSPDIFLCGYNGEQPRKTKEDVECHPIANATEVNECILGTEEQVARAPAIKTFAECKVVYGEESDEVEVGEDQGKFYDATWEDRSQQWQLQGTWSASDSLAEETNSRYALTF